MSTGYLAKSTLSPVKNQKNGKEMLGDMGRTLMALL
jgi:hypothetical protein